LHTARRVRRAGPAASDRTAARLANERDVVGATEPKQIREQAVPDVERGELADAIVERANAPPAASAPGVAVAETSCFAS
jgi:hypothetical protein